MFDVVYKMLSKVRDWLFSLLRSFLSLFHQTINSIHRMMAHGGSAIFIIKKNIQTHYNLYIVYVSRLSLNSIYISRMEKKRKIHDPCLYPWHVVIIWREKCEHFNATFTVPHAHYYQTHAWNGKQFVTFSPLVFGKQYIAKDQLPSTRNLFAYNHIFDLTMDWKFYYYFINCFSFVPFAPKGIRKNFH